MDCKAAVGIPMIISIRSKVPKVAYSAAPIFRATVCTRAIIAPPVKVAMTNQLLCRKKPDSDFTLISSRQGLEKLEQAGGGAGQRFQPDPFVRRVRLRDVA